MDMQNIINELVSTRLLEEQLLLCESSLYAFFKASWHELEGDTPLIEGPHIKAICEHLEAVLRRDIRNLVINVPPRSSKSTTVSVCFPAWAWIHRPAEQFVYASYSLDLAREHSLKCRRLIDSEWYQSRWGHLYSLSRDQKTKTNFTNDKGGSRRAISSGSSMLGSGGDILVADDINNAKDGESEVTRKGRIDWWKTLWSTRLNNRATGCRVVIAQRLHKEDISGWLLENQKPEWEHMCLPLEYDPERKFKTSVGEDWRTVEGEILWNGLTQGDIVKLKSELGSYNYAGQYQQRPTNADGGILKGSWFKQWDKSYLPKFSYIIQSVDTALTSQDFKNNSYSALTTWGLFRETVSPSLELAHPDGRSTSLTSTSHRTSLMLLSLWRGKVEQPDLLRRLRRLYKDWRDVGPEEVSDFDINLKGTNVDLMLIEEKSSGYYLLSEFRRTGIVAAGFNPNRYGDKIERVRKVSPLIETGRVWVANHPDLAFETRCGKELIENCIYFPQADSRDVVDTLTQALLRLRESNYLKHDLDNPIVSKEIN